MSTTLQKDATYVGNTALVIIIVAFLSLAIMAVAWDLISVRL